MEMPSVTAAKFYKIFRNLSGKDKGGRPVTVEITYPLYHSWILNGLNMKLKGNFEKFL